MKDEKRRREVNSSVSKIKVKEMWVERVIFQFLIS